MRLRTQLGLAVAFLASTTLSTTGQAQYYDVPDSWKDSLTSVMLSRYYSAQDLSYLPEEKRVSFRVFASESFRIPAGQEPDLAHYLLIDVIRLDLKRKKADYAQVNDADSGLLLELLPFDLILPEPSSAEKGE